MDTNQGRLSETKLNQLLRELQSRFAEATAEHPAVQELRQEVLYDTGENEEGIEVFIIVGDETPAKRTGWRFIEPIENEIRQRLHECGEIRDVYFTVGTRSESEEWDRPVDEVEDDAA